MKNNQIFAKISVICKEVFGIRKIYINSSMSDIQEWDSLKHIQLLVAIEKTFNIEISFADMIKMNSVSRIIDIVKKYLK